MSSISGKNFINSSQMQEQLLRNKFCTNRNIKVTKRILMPGHKMLFFKYKKTKQDHFSTNYASIRNLFRYLERTLQIQNQLGCIMSRLFLNTSCSQFGELVVCSTGCVVFKRGIWNWQSEILFPKTEHIKRKILMAQKRNFRQNITTITVVVGV